MWLGLWCWSQTLCKPVHSLPHCGGVRTWLFSALQQNWSNVKVSVTSANSNQTKRPKHCLYECESLMVRFIFSICKLVENYRVASSVLNSRKQKHAVEEGALGFFANVLCVYLCDTVCREKKEWVMIMWRCSLATRICIPKLKGLHQR